MDCIFGVVDLAAIERASMSGRGILNLVEVGTLDVRISLIALHRRGDRIVGGPDVRFWHKADITARLIHVRFWG